MSISAYGSGTLTTDGSEDTIQSVTVAGEFALILDYSAMQANDLIEIRLYKIVLGSGTKHLLFPPMQFAGAPTDQTAYEVFSDWIPNDITDANAIQFTIKRLAGTDRAYPWKVYQRIENVTQWNGVAVAVPATAGIPDVNVKNINNVAATAVTTINPNIGTTQPENFTGTGAAALVKIDMIDIAGSASQGAAGYVGTDQSKIANTNAAVDLSGTTIKNVDNAIANVTLVATTTTLTNAPTAGDFTATMKASLNAATPASVVGAVGSVTGNVTGSIGSLAAQAKTDVQTALTNQGYTSARAGYLDWLNTAAANIRSAIGMATNNLDTQLAAILAAITAISFAGVPATVWNYLTTAITTPGSIGKLIVSVLSLINVNNITITPPFDADALTLTLRHNDDYTGDAGGAITINGINSLDLTDPNIASVILSIKQDTDLSTDVVPLVTQVAVSVTQHTATFNFTNAQMGQIYAANGYVFDIVAVYTDGTRRTAVYGSVSVEDSVTPVAPSS